MAQRNLFPSVNFTLMMAQRFMEAAATSPQKGLVDGDESVAVHNGAPIDWLSDNGKYANGIWVEYEKEKPSDPAYRAWFEGLEWLKNEKFEDRPSAESLAEAFEQLGSRAQDDAARRQRQYNALRTGMIDADISRRQARGILRIAEKQLAENPRAVAGASGLALRLGARDLLEIASLESRAVSVYSLFIMAGLAFLMVAVLHVHSPLLLPVLLTAGFEPFRRIALGVMNKIHYRTGVVIPTMEEPVTGNMELAKRATETFARSFHGTIPITIGVAIIAASPFSLLTFLGVVLVLAGAIMGEWSHRRGNKEVLDRYDGGVIASLLAELGILAAVGADARNTRPPESVTTSPAKAFLSVLGLENSDMVAQRQIHSWQEGATTIRRIELLPDKNTKNPQGLDLLSSELYPGCLQFDLLYNRSQELIAIVPVITDETRRQLAEEGDQVPEQRRPRYFNVRPYQLILSAWGDPHAAESWRDSTISQQEDQSAIDYYLSSRSLTGIVQPPKSYFRPYVYAQVDKKTGEIVLDYFDPLDTNPFQKYKVNSDYHQIVFPVFPTVYWPRLLEDEEYHRTLFPGALRKRDGDDPLNIRAGHSVWVVGAGSGFDTWLVALQTRTKVMASGINPFEIANTKLLANLAHFEVDAFVADNIIDSDGRPVRPDIMVDRCIWGMPFYVPIGAQPPGRLEDFHDGDVGGVTFKRFVSGLKLILKENGLSLAWNSAHVRLLTDIARTAGLWVRVFHVSGASGLYLFKRSSFVPGASKHDASSRRAETAV
jgi:hypothetical protein